jgi:hypothetical protein
MKRFAFALVLTLVLSTTVPAVVDYANLGDDTWVQQATGGEACSRGGDVHCAIDTSGNLYLFGGCTYGNGAGGSHNADVYRVDLRTGIGDRITIASKPSSISCQRAQTYDPKRHVCYFDAGGGLIKYQCPDGPFTRVRDLPFSGDYRYLMYDPGNDLLIFAGDPGIWLYDITADSLRGTAYPFGGGKITRWDIPCCFDTKRGLFAITLAAPYTVNTPATQVIWDVHFYNPATRQWHTKTPPSTPQIYKGELAYDSYNDKYLYFGGGCPSELWSYDYDSNTWTQVAQAGRTFNDANPTAGTWPPARHKHIWEYCSKYNVCVNWMGGQWAPDSCTDYDAGAQPLWIYRLSDSGTGVDGNVRVIFDRPEIAVTPNPFSGNVTISWANVGAINESPLQLAIYDLYGRMVQKTVTTTHPFTWNSAGLPSGIYLLKYGDGRRTLGRRLILQK